MPASSTAQLLELLPQEWEALLAEWGEPRYRARQIFRWIHQRGVTDPAQMSDLPKALRSRMSEAGLSAPLEVVQDQHAADGTRKLLLELTDGRRVESVLIPRSLAGDAPDVFGDEDLEEDAASDAASDAAAASDRVEGSDPSAAVITQCVSSQVGCAMGCAFCASGIAGLKRQLSAAEIVGQVHGARRALRAGQRLGGVVYMGMGEPLHNYEAVARSLRLISHPDGLGLSLRRITISTSGLVPQIERLGREFGGRVQLAISLHAVDDARRSRIMPINRKHPLDQLLACLRHYPVSRRQRITVEYTLIQGINDSPRDARRLVELLEGLRVRVNLIPMNPVTGSTLAAPDASAVAQFQQILRSGGLLTLVRQRKGDDIDAACGQLALHGEKRRVRVLPA